MSRSKRTAVSMLGVAAVIGAAAAAPALAAPANGRHVLPGSVPSWARSATK
jgi:hypothetical protein